MTDDEEKARRWLLGRGSKTSTVRDDEARRHKQHIGELGGKAALRRVLRSPEPLSHEIRQLLAGALEGNGAGAMQLILIRRAGRGRPAHDRGVASVKAAIEESQVNASIDAQKAERTKTSIAYENAAKEFGLSRPKVIELRKKRRGKKEKSDLFF
jgi:hypothetical protein